MFVNKFFYLGKLFYLMDISNHKFPEHYEILVNTHKMRLFLQTFRSSESRVLYCANDLEVRTFLNCRRLLLYLGISRSQKCAKELEVWTFPNSHYRSQMSFSYLGKITYVDVRIDLKFGVFRTESQKILGDGTEILLVDRFRATREPVKKRDSNTEKDKTFPFELTVARKICYFVNTYARMFCAQTHECF
jgi:hypothetical protein